MPDYNKLRKLFEDGLRKRKFTNDGQTVTFRTADSASSRTADSASSSNEEAVDNPDEMVGKTGFFLEYKNAKEKNVFVIFRKKVKARGLQ